MVKPFEGARRIVVAGRVFGEYGFRSDRLRLYQAMNIITASDMQPALTEDLDFEKVKITPFNDSHEQNRTMIAKFSHSRLSSYETCPLRYKFAYIDKIKVEAEDTVETFLGSRVHEALEKLYRNLQFEQLLTEDEVLSFFNREWEKNWNDSIIIVNRDYTKENYRKMGERYLKDYYRRYKPFSGGKILGLETTDTLPLDKESKYGFYIRIDRLMDMGNGLYEVHDYKTNMTLPRQEDLDKDRQLAMYSLWVREQFKNFKNARLVWHFLAFDKEMESYRTEKQLEELRAQVLDDIDEIETAQDFPAKVTRLCNWCLYKSACPEWKHEIQIQDIPVNEFLNDPGVSLVDEYVKVKTELDTYKKKAEAKLDKLKEALIAFCEREGVSTVFGKEKKISVRKHESFKFPPKGSEKREDLVAFLRNIDRLNDLSELDVRNLANVLKDREWDDADLLKLKEFATKETSYRLSMAKHERSKE